MVLHGPSGSMQFLVKGTRQVLLNLMDWHILNSIIDLQISLFDVELCLVILMTVFPELGQSLKLSYITISYICVDFLPSKRWVRCAVFCRLPHAIQDQSVTRISGKTQLFDRMRGDCTHRYKTSHRLRTACAAYQEKNCDASEWYGMEWRCMDSD